MNTKKKRAEYPWLGELIRQTSDELSLNKILRQSAGIGASTLRNLKKV